MLGHVVSQYACGDRGKPALCGAWCPTRTNRVWNRVVQPDGMGMKCFHGCPDMHSAMNILVVGSCELECAYATDSSSSKCLSL